MSLIPLNNNKRCYVPCTSQKILAGMCSCNQNKVIMTKSLDLTKKEQSILLSLIKDKITELKFEIEIEDDFNNKPTTHLNDCRTIKKKLKKYFEE